MLPSAVVWFVVPIAAALVSKILFENVLKLYGLSGIQIPRVQTIYRLMHLHGGVYLFSQKMYNKRNRREWSDEN